MIALVTALTDRRFEEAVVAGLERGVRGVRVVRRCVDLADLLACVAAGTGTAVLVSADLRRFDRSAVDRLRAQDVAVVGAVAAGDEDAERRLRQMGVQDVLSSAATVAEVVGAVRAAVVRPGEAGPAEAGSPGAEPALATEAGGGVGAADRPRRRDERRAAARRGSPRRSGEPGGPTTAGPGDAELDGFDLDGAAADRSDGSVPGRPSDDLAVAPGRVIAVWGPAGAPGRTTVAVGIATETARAGVRTLLVDADTYGACIASVLGIVDEAPGILAAARRANAGTLDVPGLAGLARAVDPRLAVLTGSPRPDRWSELGAGLVSAILDVARRLAPVVVVDCGFCLEDDEDLSYDTLAPRRNGATLAALEAADDVVAVAAADPVGLHRFVLALPELRERSGGARPLVVVNRVRRAGFAGSPAQEVATALDRLAGVRPTAVLPDDRAAVDAALTAGRALHEVASSAPLRLALADLADRLITGSERVRPAAARRGLLRWRIRSALARSAVG